MSPKRRTSASAVAELLNTWLQRLEKHMWIERHLAELTTRGLVVDIRGLLKHQPNEGGGRAVRRMFMDVLDQALDELGSHGAVHLRHPDVYIGGEVLRSFDKPDDFGNMQCEVTFYILIEN